MASSTNASNNTHSLIAGERIMFENLFQETFFVVDGPCWRVGTAYKADIYLGTVVNAQGWTRVLLKCRGRKTPGSHLSQSEINRIHTEKDIGMSLHAVESAVPIIGASYDHTNYFCIALEPLDTLVPFVDTDDRISLAFYCIWAFERCC